MPNFVKNSSNKVLSIGFIAENNLSISILLLHGATTLSSGNNNLDINEPRRRKTGQKFLE